MSIQQIPSILKSMHLQFGQKSAIKITNSQFMMMKDIIRDYCKTNDAPRLYGILGRISRRMKQPNNPHLWATEYNYFANKMMQSLRENDYCRLDDDIENIHEIFNRHNSHSEPGFNRHDDRSQIMSIFG